LDDSYCNTIDKAYSNYSSDDIQWQSYLAANIIQFHFLAILTQNQIPLRYTSEFPILLHHPPSAPRSLSKSNPVDSRTFAQGGTNPGSLPSHTLHVHYGGFIPFYSTWKFWLGSVGTY